MIMRTAAVAAIMLASGTVAMAQTTTTPPPVATAPGSAMQPQWYTHQAGEMRASKLIGTSVKNNAGETVGDINEVVLNKDGQVAAVIIGVGGFLGIGERQVAVSFKSLRLVHDSNNRTLATLNVDKEALKAAPEWRWTSDDRSGTTGSGGSTR